MTYRHRRPSGPHQPPRPRPSAAGALDSSTRYPQSRLLTSSPRRSKVSNAASASVFSAVRTRGPIARDAIAQSTQLANIATVNRRSPRCWKPVCCANAPDLAVSAPSGAHGFRSRSTTNRSDAGHPHRCQDRGIVATDLFGRTLDVVGNTDPTGAQSAALATLAASARQCLSHWHRPRRCGSAPPAGGRQHHGIYQTIPGSAGTTPRWAGAGRGARHCCVTRRTSRDGRCRVAAGRTSARARRRRWPVAHEPVRLRPGAVGYALSIDGRVHSPASGPGVAGLPARSNCSGRRAIGIHRERRGRADRGPQAAQSRRKGLRPRCRRCCAPPARVRERPANCSPTARVLGEAVALLHDMLNPDS